MPVIVSLIYALVTTFFVQNKRIESHGLSGCIRIELKLTLIIDSGANQID